MIAIFKLSPFIFGSMLTIFISCRENITEVITEENLNPSHSHGSLQINSPAKWELWRQNKSYQITWDSSLDNNQLKIELVKKDVVIILVSPTTEDDGIFDWQIPNNVINSNMYQIKITSLTNPGKYVISNQFSIRDF